MAFASLKYDHVFREVFSRENVLRPFISDVTGIPQERIKTVRVISPFLWRRYQKQKQGILDVALILNDNTRINIELQIRVQKFWIKRKLFYLAKMYTEDLKMGENYERLRKCISISILDFSLIPGDGYHAVYTLKDRDGRELTDLFEAHIIELKKEVKDGDVLADWIRLFNARTREELDRIEMQNKGVLEAMEVVKTMSLGKSLRWMYEEHLKAVRDRWAEDEYVKDLGREEGRAEGREEGRVEELVRQVCRKLIKGKSVEVIAEELEGSVDEISRIVEVAEKFAPDYDAERVYKAYRDLEKANLKKELI